MPYTKTTILVLRQSQSQDPLTEGLALCGCLWHLRPGKVNSLVESFLILADGRYTYCKPRSLLHRQGPQGTVLGPILFRLLIYLNDTESCIFQFRSLISSFADVTRIIRAISITTRVKDILLQQNLVNCNVSQWLNKATLNNVKQR